MFFKINTNTNEPSVSANLTKSASLLFAPPLPDAKGEPPDDDGGGAIFFLRDERKRERQRERLRWLRSFGAFFPNAGSSFFFSV